MNQSNVFSKESIVECEHCGKNLLDNINSSMLQIITNEDNKIVTIKPCCKGVCDRTLSSDMSSNHFNRWIALSTFTNPITYLKNIMAALNNTYYGVGFANKDALEIYKAILVQMYPFVSRDATDEEKLDLNI